MGRTKILTDEQREENYRESLKKYYVIEKTKRNEDPERKRKYNEYQREYQKKRNLQKREEKKRQDEELAELKLMIEKQQKIIGCISVC